LKLALKTLYVWEKEGRQKKKKKEKCVKKDRDSYISIWA